ncbi:hypothetical protein E5288_WYG014903 [Bos mutus]|uniref:Uncharacterized protein n=1 Tax=Bos mutus TaxID=72004 RepID=A0A6B0S4U4_9CETA|nr:hypothetical protein [Bos mutus]
MGRLPLHSPRERDIVDRPPGHTCRDPGRLPIVAERGRGCVARLPQTAGDRQPPCEEKGTSRGPADRPLYVAPHRTQPSPSPVHPPRPPRSWCPGLR